jgi:hypothetical protein
MNLISGLEMIYLKMHFIILLIITILKYQKEYMRRAYMPAVAKAMLENINLFIDVTKISNKYDSEGIAINCEYKKKNITPITLICDQNKLP